MLPWLRIAPVGDSSLVEECERDSTKMWMPGSDEIPRVFLKLMVKVGFGILGDPYDRGFLVRTCA